MRFQSHLMLILLMHSGLCLNGDGSETQEA